jgi:hypothetical protein
MKIWPLIVGLPLMLQSGMALADDGWYGEAASADAEPVSVAQVLRNIDAWQDKPLTVSGEVTDVCTHRGCWAVFVADGDMLRIKARDHLFAMPSEYRGPALAHGVLERVAVTPEHARHLVEDDGADPAILEQEFEYRLIADGVRLGGEG